MNPGLLELQNVVISEEMIEACKDMVKKEGVFCYRLKVLSRRLFVVEYCIELLILIVEQLALECFVVFSHATTVSRSEKITLLPIYEARQSVRIRVGCISP